MGIPFVKTSKEEIILNNQKFIYKKFYQELLGNPKYPNSASSVYLEPIGDKILAASADGIIFYFNKFDLNQENFQGKIIQSNIQNIIKNKKIFETNDGWGIKGLMIFQNKMYLSFQEQVKNNCYNTSIIRSDLNFNFLRFQIFFSNEFCVSNNDENEDFEKLQSGGKMFPLDNENIIFTHGEYRNRYLAQKDDNIFGKIIKINIHTQKYEILSKGHRNSHGLVYLNSQNVILATEHGPQGGDELNLIKISNNNLNNSNYGWPQASYGEHYGGKNDKSNLKRYERYPLLKSHEKHGFIEPLIYFVPSIGINELVFLSNDLQKKLNSNILISALGKTGRKGNMGLHLIGYSFNKKNIFYKSFLPLKERVRDIAILDDNKIIMYLETTGSIAILE